MPTGQYLNHQIHQRISTPFWNKVLLGLVFREGEVGSLNPRMPLTLNCLPSSLHGCDTSFWDFLTETRIQHQAGKPYLPNKLLSKEPVLDSFSKSDIAWHSCIKLQIEE